MENIAIMYNDRVYDSFEDIFEKLECDLNYGTIEPEDLVIEYEECRLEKCFEFNVEDLVTMLMEDRDDEEGRTSDIVIKVFNANMNVDKIKKQIPSLYYPYGGSKRFDLRELDEYKEWLAEKGGQSDVD